MIRSDRFLTGNAWNKLSNNSTCCWYWITCLLKWLNAPTHFYRPQLYLRPARCFINQEGRAQFADAILHGGIPISQVSAGSHPPRVFQPIIPGGEPRPAWQALAELAQAMSPQEKHIAQDDLWALLAGDHPALAGLADPAPGSDGRRIIPAQSPATAFSLSPGPAPKQPSENQLQVLLVDWTFGAEELSGYSNAIQQVEKQPCLFMHAEDAARAVLSDGDQVVIQLDTGSLQVKLCVSLNMAPGVVVLPRHRQLAWQKLRRYPAMLNLGQMEKVQQTRSDQQK